LVLAARILKKIRKKKKSTQTEEFFTREIKTLVRYLTMMVREESLAAKAKKLFLGMK